MTIGGEPVVVEEKRVEPGGELRFEFPRLEPSWRYHQALAMRPSDGAGFASNAFG